MRPLCCVAAYTTQGVPGSHHSLVSNILRLGRFGSAGFTRLQRNVAGPRNRSLTSCFPGYSRMQLILCLGNYQTLQLSNRFMKIETETTYTKFDRRTQKHGEYLEAYAAELKHFYNKAYPDREDKTRRVDLLRRCLNGVLDRDAAQQVAFAKDSSDINNAVFELVSLVDSHGPNERQPKRHDQIGRARGYSTDELAIDSEDEAPQIRATGRPGHKPKGTLVHGPDTPPVHPPPGTYETYFILFLGLVRT